MKSIRTHAMTYAARIESVMKHRCPRKVVKKVKGEKTLDLLPWQLLDQRDTEASHDLAFIVPSGYSARDLMQETDALFAAVGGYVKIIDRGGVVVVSISKKDFPPMIKWTDDYLQLAKGRQVLLGFDQLGNPIIHDFRVPHMMVVGMSGYGKTDCIRMMLYQLIARFTPEQLDICIIDMKGFSFMPFRGIPHISRIVRDLPGAVHILKEAYLEMNRRSDIVWTARDRSVTSGFRWKMIIIDEASQISPSLKETKADKELAAECSQYAAAISCIGREAGIGLLYGTQYPTREVIRGQIKANMDAVVCFKTLNDIHSDVALDKPDAAFLPHGTPGRAISKSTTLTTMQVPYVGDDDKWTALLAPYVKEADQHEPAEAGNDLSSFFE